MTDKEIKDILLSQADIEKIIRENPGISKGDIERVINKINGVFNSRGEGVYYLHVDGASRGNPGDSGIGALIRDGDKKTVEEYCEYIGRQTNNAAEYMALIGGLKKVKKYNPSVLKIFSDSQLMVQQVKGAWRVKDSNLMILYNEVRGLLNGIDSWEINAVPRNENKRADALANMGIDTGRK
ncbi:ribonuclease HI family protein [bacterium]|nr:ribonuclease HI family protein [bacterium]